jgi:hypothetical protein
VPNKVRSAFKNSKEVSSNCNLELENYFGQFDCERIIYFDISECNNSSMSLGLTYELNNNTCRDQSYPLTTSDKVKLEARLNEIVNREWADTIIHARCSH